jgi:3-oxoacyl-[acyl-carrier protein] reductase
MDLGLSGRRAAVAAGTAGLGLATARALVREGVSVAVCGRDTERLDAALTELRAAAGSGGSVGSVGSVAPVVEGLVVDLSDTDEAERFVTEAALRLGGTIDILVPNAGGPPPGTFATTELEDYRAALELNCLSTIAMCCGAVPGMQEQRWGRVVAITSIGAREPISHLIASSTARAAVSSFLKVLAREVAADGVMVNSLQPGLHRTDRVAQLYGDGQDPGAGIPVGEPGDPDDFGATAAFLCSRHAGFITGIGLPLDGGTSHGMP